MLEVARIHRNLYYPQVRSGEVEVSSGGGAKPDRFEKEEASSPLLPGMQADITYRQWMNPDGTPGGWVAEGVEPPPNTYIGADAIINPGSKIGSGVSIGNATVVNGAEIRDHCTIGNQSKIDSNAVLLPHCALGDSNRIGSNTTFWTSSAGSNVSFGSECAIVAKSIGSDVHFGDRVSMSSGTIGSNVKGENDITMGTVAVGNNCTFDGNIMLESGVNLKQTIVHAKTTLHYGVTAIGTEFFGMGTEVGKSAQFFNDVKIGPGNKLAELTIFRANTRTDSDVTVGYGAILDADNRIGEGASIGQFAHLGQGVTVKPFAYVPDHAEIPPGTTFPSNA